MRHNDPMLTSHHRPVINLNFVPFFPRSDEEWSDIIGRMESLSWEAVKLAYQCVGRLDDAEPHDGSKSSITNREVIYPAAVRLGLLFDDYIDLRSRFVTMNSSDMQDGDLDPKIRAISVRNMEICDHNSRLFSDIVSTFVDMVREMEEDDISDIVENYHDDSDGYVEMKKEYPIPRIDDLISRDFSDKAFRG